MPNFLNMQKQDRVMEVPIARRLLLRAVNYSLRGGEIEGELKLMVNC